MFSGERHEHERTKSAVFDVDGTLLSEITGQIPESALKAVQKAREKGHLAFINSGRVSCLLDPVRKLIAMDGYLRLRNLYSSGR